MTLNINGRSSGIDIAADIMLADALGDKLAVTGNAIGCRGGTCGACTVLVNGSPVLACLTLTALCEGAEIVTWEGLTSQPALRPVRQALISRSVTPCGACSAGILVSAAALLMSNPRPTRDDVRHALAGHVCRCAGYSAIIDAVIADAETTAEADWPTGFSRNINETQARLAHQCALDPAAKAGDTDPVSALRSRIEDHGQAAALVEAATKFEWNSRWNGWGSSESGRLKRGLGASMQSDQPAILNPAFSVFCLVDLEVDIETGVISLGSSFALATAPGLVPLDSGMVEAGMMEGLFAALLEEPDATAGLTPSVELFPAKFPTAIDVVDLTCQASSWGSGPRPSMSRLKQVACDAMICAIEAGIFHATGKSCSTLPFDVGRTVRTDNQVHTDSR